MIFSYRKATPADFDLTFHIKSYSIKPHVEMVWVWCAPYLGPLVKLDNGLNLDPYERQGQAQVYRRFQAQSRS